MVRKVLSEGAESHLYSERIYGLDVVVKVREPKKYRTAALDNELRKSRTRTEAKVLHRLKNAGLNVPALIAVGKYSIFMERLSGKLLRDTRATPTILGEIGTALAKMHTADVAHGDFTPANLMICGHSVFVIDFGLAEITTSIEEKALDLLLIKRSLSETEYGRLLESYRRHYGGAAQTLKRLSAIEQRGRYQTRTLA